MDKVKQNKQLNEFNDIPVLYCKHCLSLKIRNIPMINDSDFCDQCGSTDIERCNIEEWETIYKNRYGHKYLDNY